MEMTAERWQYVKALLEETLLQPPALRGAWLEERCSDVDVRLEVLSLLEAHSEVEDFLEQPARAGAELVSALRPETLTGERIGPWMLVEEIGRGGMGTVYRAVRADEEFRREVAIKIVARGMDTDMLLRRFRTERQILANLEHPYIARLLDGGTTPGGLPYFVMEYVQGKPLTEYCDRRRLGVAERIELFRKVCSAVSYAHQNLVVHRDLKPANILVTADGTPKLLDFGIARILRGPEGRETSEPTVTMLRMATPAYASPEQIRGSVAGVPSDVYSLGVILYELLTGHRPYRLPSRDSSELARVICEREPTRASAVVGFTESIERSDGSVTVVDAAGVCDDRDTTVDQLRRRLRGDLDNILAMALRKEPHRRYESVDQFSSDLQRHLVGLPIHARRDTWNYRLSKFIERNRVGVIASAFVALMLLSLTIVALHKASQLAHRIEEDHKLATSFLVEIHDQIARLPGATPAREAILQRSLKYLNELSRAAGDDPQFLRSLALAYEKFAELQVGLMGPGLGKSNEALNTCRKGQELREAVARIKPDDRQVQYELANNYLLAGYIAGRAGTTQVRRSYDQQALAIAEKLVTADGRNPGYRSVLARAHSSLAYGLLYDDQWEQARRHLRQSLAIHMEIAAENPSDLRAQRELAQIHYRLGATHVDEGRPAHAREHLESALELQQRISMLDPDNAQFRSDIAATHHFLGIAVGALGQHEDALRHFSEAFAIRRTALAADARDTRSKLMLAGSYSEQARVLLRSGDPVAAVASASTAVYLQQEALAHDPHSIPVRISMARFQARLGAAQTALAAHLRRAAICRESDASLRSAVSLFEELDAQGHLRSPALRTEAEAAKEAIGHCDASGAAVQTIRQPGSSLRQF